MLLVMVGCGGRLVFLGFFCGLGLGDECGFEWDILVLGGLNDLRVVVICF